MSWHKVDDRFGDHPKVLALLARKGGLASIGLWTLAGAWASGMRTAVVPAAIVQRFASRKEAENLVAVGLWEKDGSDYRIHDWADYQPKEDARAATAERVRRYRERQRNASDVTCNALHGTLRNGVTRNGVLVPDPTRPDPTRPDPVSPPHPPTESARLAKLAELIAYERPTCLHGAFRWPPGAKALQKLWDAVLVNWEPSDVHRVLLRLGQAIDAGHSAWPQGKPTKAVWAPNGYLWGHWSDIVATVDAAIEVRDAKKKSDESGIVDAIPGQVWGT